METSVTVFKPLLSFTSCHKKARRVPRDDRQTLLCFHLILIHSTDGGKAEAVRNQANPGNLFQDTEGKQGMAKQPFFGGSGKVGQAEIYFV
jgi:hypothetical protein